jgi:hypothetical protein
MKVLPATQRNTIHRLENFRQLVGIILLTSDTRWNFYVEDGFRFQVQPRYRARETQRSSPGWQNEKPRERTAAKEQTFTETNDANSILASGMVTCTFSSTFLIFLYFSLLYFVLIYSCPLFILAAFLVIKGLRRFFSASDTVRRRTGLENLRVQHSKYLACALWLQRVQ